MEVVINMCKKSQSLLPVGDATFHFRASTYIPRNARFSSLTESRRVSDGMTSRWTFRLFLENGHRTASFTGKRSAVRFRCRGNFMCSPPKLIAVHFVQDNK